MGFSTTIPTCLVENNRVCDAQPGNVAINLYAQDALMVKIINGFSRGSLRVTVGPKTFSLYAGPGASGKNGRAEFVHATDSISSPLLSASPIDIWNLTSRTGPTSISACAPMPSGDWPHSCLNVAMTQITSPIAGYGACQEAGNSCGTCPASTGLWQMLNYTAIFKDIAASSHTLNPPTRYINAAGIALDGTIVKDFNLTYNAPCPDETYIDLAQYTVNGQILHVCAKYVLRGSYFPLKQYLTDVKIEQGPDPTSLTCPNGYTEVNAFTVGLYPKSYKVCNKYADVECCVGATILGDTCGTDVVLDKTCSGTNTWSVTVKSGSDLESCSAELCSANGVNDPVYGCCGATVSKGGKNYPVKAYGEQNSSDAQALCIDEVKNMSDPAQFITEWLRADTLGTYPEGTDTKTVKIHRGCGYDFTGTEAKPTSTVSYSNFTLFSDGNTWIPCDFANFVNRSIPDAAACVSKCEFENITLCQINKSLTAGSTRNCVSEFKNCTKTCGAANILWNFTGPGPFMQMLNFSAAGGAEYNHSFLCAVAKDTNGLLGKPRVYECAPKPTGEPDKESCLLPGDFAVDNPYRDKNRVMLTGPGEAVEVYNLTGNGLMTTFYCTNITATTGVWVQNADTVPSACRGTTGNWTGSYCCSEPEDRNAPPGEWYNEWGKVRDAKNKRQLIIFDLNRTRQGSSYVTKTDAYPLSQVNQTWFDTVGADVRSVYISKKMGGGLNYYVSYATNASTPKKTSTGVTQSAAATYSGNLYTAQMLSTGNNGDTENILKNRFACDKPEASCNYLYKQEYLSPVLSYYYVNMSDKWKGYFSINQHFFEDPKPDDSTDAVKGPYDIVSLLPTSRIPEFFGAITSFTPYYHLASGKMHYYIVTTQYVYNSSDGGATWTGKKHGDFLNGIAGQPSLPVNSKLRILSINPINDSWTQIVTTADIPLDAGTMSGVCVNSSLRPDGIVNITATAGALLSQGGVLYACDAQRSYWQEYKDLNTSWTQYQDKKDWPLQRFNSTLNISDLVDNPDNANPLGKQQAPWLVQDVPYCTQIESSAGKYICNWQYENWTSIGERGQPAILNRSALKFVAWDWGSANNPEEAASCCEVNQCWNGTACLNDQLGNPDADAYPTPIGKLYCLNGRWANQSSKFTWDRNQTGFCKEEFHCLVNATGDIDTLEPTRFYLAEQNPSLRMPMCIDNGSFIYDHYCENGNWTTRTKFLAAAMLNFSGSSTNYRLVCGNATEIAQRITGYQITVPNANGQPGTQKVYPLTYFVNPSQYYPADQMCFMEFAQGAATVKLMGIINNPDGKHNVSEGNTDNSVLHVLGRDPNVCNRTNIDYSKNNLTKCRTVLGLSSQVYYNPVMDMVLVSTSNGPSAFWFDFASQLRTAKDRIASVFKNNFKFIYGAEFLDLNNNIAKAINDTADFDKLFIGRNGSMYVYAVYGPLLYDKDQKLVRYITIDYQGLPEVDICKTINRLPYASNNCLNQTTGNSKITVARSETIDDDPSVLPTSLFMNWPYLSGRTRFP